MEGVVSPHHLDALMPSVPNDKPNIGIPSKFNCPLHLIHRGDIHRVRRISADFTW